VEDFMQSSKAELAAREEKTVSARVESFLLGLLCAAVAGAQHFDLQSAGGRFC
jgi:hypothetical protein